MKKISILCPCYNEEENIVPIIDAILDEAKKNLQNYNYEIVIVDNCSTDNTVPLIREICKKHPQKVKAILNSRNFRANSFVHAIKQVDGDCAINICSDFQNPVELIHVFVEEWEKGYKVICRVKCASEENKFIYFIRNVFYKIMHKFSTAEQIEQFTGFGLYDKSFIDVLRQLDDSFPFFRGIVGEYGGDCKQIEFVQPKRRAGKSKMNFWSLYDTAMNGITSYTKIGIRMGTFIGIFLSIINALMLIIVVVVSILNKKLCYWGVLVALNFLMIGMLMSFMGLIGEYILAINIRELHRPLVIEKERINF